MLVFIGPLLSEVSGELTKSSAHVGLVGWRPPSVASYSIFWGSIH